MIIHWEKTNMYHLNKIERTFILSILKKINIEVLNSPLFQMSL